MFYRIHFFFNSIEVRSQKPVWDLKIENSQQTPFLVLVGLSFPGKGAFCTHLFVSMLSFRSLHRMSTNSDSSISKHSMIPHKPDMNVPNQDLVMASILLGLTADALDPSLGVVFVFASMCEHMETCGCLPAVCYLIHYICSFHPVFTMKCLT